MLALEVSIDFVEEEEDVDVDLLVEADWAAVVGGRMRGDLNGRRRVAEAEDEGRGRFRGFGIGFGGCFCSCASACCSSCFCSAIGIYFLINEGDRQLNIGERNGSCEAPVFRSFR